MDSIERFDIVGTSMQPSITGQWVKWSHAADVNSAAWKSADVIRKRRQVQEDSTPEISDVFDARAYFGWGWTGCGFGQLSFDYDRETGKWVCMNECMSRDSVRRILHALADHIADNVELEE